MALTVLRLLAYASILALPISAKASIAEEANLTIIVSPGGGISIRRSGAEIAAVVPGVFLKGWNYRSLAIGKHVEGKTGTTRVDLESGISIIVHTSVTAHERYVQVGYTITPSSTVSVESAHVSLNLPAALWAGSKLEFGAETLDLPQDYDELHLAGGTVARVKVGPSGQLSGTWAVVETDSPRRAMVQDNRKWSNPGAFELRIGEFSKAPWTWGPGNPLEVEFDLAFNSPIEVVYDKPVILKANKNWIPLRGNLEIKAGSALDFSRFTFTRTPAGSEGWLCVSASDPDALEFERARGKPVRFYGPNFCFGALYPTHAEADKLANRLRRLGCNTMRIHHYETVWSGKEAGLVDPKAKNSLTFQPAALDRLDYFFAALKKRGIYITTDLYVNRSVKASEVFDGADGNLAYRFKNLVHVSDRALNNMKAFCRKLLGHVNPYTGLTWGNDPALAWIAIINEGNLPNTIGNLTKDPREARLWYAAFDRWKEKTGINGEWGDSPAGKRFLWETHLVTQKKLIKFLREELKMKALLTDLNGWADHAGTQVCRKDFDYVDNHYYWDHPSFLGKNWQLPTKGWSGNASAITRAGGFSSRALTRLLDRPFTISEYNFCAPNPYRAEGSPLMAAFAALQDWAVLWRFTYSHSHDNMFKPGPMNFFDNVSDPLRQASEYTTVSLFTRRDAAPAKHTIAIVGKEKEYMKNAHVYMGGDIDHLGWVVKLGTHVESDRRDRLPKDRNRLDVSLKRGLKKGARKELLKKIRSRGFLPKTNRTDLAAGIYESETGEIMLDTKRGVMEISTPRTIVLAGPPGTERTLGPLTAKIDECWATVSAISRDGKPIAKAERILLTHLTNLANTGMKFRGRDMVVLEAWGKMPYLVRAGTATIRLERHRAESLKVWRLDLSGKRIARVPADVASGIIEFEVNSATKPDATLYYEIALR